MSTWSLRHRTTSFRRFQVGAIEVSSSLATVRSSTSTSALERYPALDPDALRGKLEDFLRDLESPGGSQ